jgi:hypothetical protein
MWLREDCVFKVAAMRKGNLTVMLLSIDANLIVLKKDY